MNKKGQISVYIIVGLLIIFIVGGFLAVKNRQDLEKISLEAVPVKNYVDSCLEDSLIKSLRSFGIQGVVFEDPQDIENLSLVSVPYFYYLGENRMPLKEEVEDILSYYIEGYFNECINNFTGLKQEGYEIKYSEKGVFSTKIEPRKVNIYLKFPLSIVRGDTTEVLENFGSELDFDFDRVYNVILDFIEEQDKNPGYIPIGHVGVVSNSENVSIKMIELPEDDILYLFIFRDVKLEGESYLLLFGVKYDFGDLYEENEI